MRKPKINCFRYRHHNDIYVSNVTFSSDELLAIMDILPCQKVIVLIELDANYAQVLSSIGKSIGIQAVMPHSSSSRLTLACSITELQRLLCRANMDDFEGLFIASINENIISDEFMHSLDYAASSMVKNGISDISITINFAENQMVISLINGKYARGYIKDKICSIFKD